MLVWEGKIKLMDYGGALQVGDLRLTIWLDVPPSAGMDYNAVNIPPEVIAQADQILSTFTLRP